MSSLFSKYHQEYRDWLTLKNYSPKTLKCYLSSLRKFWDFCESRQGDADFVKEDAPKLYLLYRYNEQQVSWQTVNGDYSSLRLFYKHVLQREWDLCKLPRPRKQKSLPNYGFTEVGNLWQYGKKIHISL